MVAMSSICVFNERSSRITFQIIISYFLYTIIVFPSTAQAFHRPSLRELVEKSPIICTGTVTSVARTCTKKPYGEKGRDYSVEVLRADVRIGKILRGSIPDDAVIYCERENYLRRGWGGIYEGHFLFFLMKNDAGDAYIPFNMVRFFACISEEAVGASTTSASEVLRVCLRSHDARLVYWAIDGLQELNYPFLAHAVEPLTRSSDDKVRGKALLALFSAGETNRFQECLDFIRECKGTSLEQGIAAEIACSFIRIRARYLVPKLNQLLRDSDPELRRYSSWALAEMHEESSIPYFAQCLFNPLETNPQTQYNCLIGIYRTLGKDRPSNEHDFLANRARYVREFEEWWRLEGWRFPSIAGDSGISGQEYLRRKEGILKELLSTGLGLSVVATLIWLFSSGGRSRKSMSH